MNVKKLDRVLSLSPNYRVETRAQPGGLFVAALADFAYARTIALLFILAMTMLIAGLILFLWEVNLAMRSVRVNRNLIARAPGD